jgi:reactive intermediate/imine deaminase
MNRVLLAAFLATLLCPLSAEIRAIVPPNAPKPVGPYTPGVMAGDYLYVSGQGASSPGGEMPAEFDAQVRQTLENVKAIVEAAGLTMEHVVYTQVYLEDIHNFEAMNRVYATYFPKNPPARATLGVARLPGTPVEINAVAVKDLANKTPVAIPGHDPGEPLSPGILTHDRLFVSAMRGRALQNNQTPADPGQQVDLALDGVAAVLRAAGLDMRHMVFVNPYLTDDIPARVMNERYAKRFEFGNTPARATISVAALPEGAQIEYTGVAVRDLSRRLAVRPKNMAPSPTASPCVFAADTLYCSAKDGFIPGPRGGIYSSTVEHQMRQTMRNLLDGLEEAGLDFSNTVSANVYLDNVPEDFKKMNGVYAQYYGTIPPARTTVQQVAPTADRGPSESGHYPPLEQVSIVAVRDKP